MEEIPLTHYDSQRSNGLRIFGSLLLDCFQVFDELEKSALFVAFLVDFGLVACLLEDLFYFAHLVFVQFVVRHVRV